MKVILIVGLLLLLEGCLSENIEDRCIDANLAIKSLSIEDTHNGQSHAKVECQSRAYERQ